MSVLSVAEAQSFSALASVSAPALQLAIDDIESEIVRRYGAYYPDPYVATLTILPETGPIVLDRRVSSIVSVVETLASAGTPLPTRTLDPTDYALRGVFLVERLSAGPTPARGWSRYGVVVTAIPVDDTSSRKMAVVDVLKTEIAHSGFTSRRIGEYSEATGGNGASANDVTGERSKILRRLRPHAIVIR